MIMKRIEILYFGLLKQAAGCANESVQTDAQTALELYRERASTLAFDYPEASAKFALNESFCQPEAALDDGDTLAIMPPMAGG